jgi:glyoxylase-like metal-dependent hydrolase (beta-lactamase superfamily II)
VDYLCEQARNKGYKITQVFLTHGHPDHVNGLEEILARHDVPAYISSSEAPFYKPDHQNLVEVENHAGLKVGAMEWECILTPGHSPGCQCFLYENVLIAGDAIFIDGCGRCDLPGGNAKVMYRSLYDILMKLPDDTLLFTGHNYGPVPYATLGEQKKTNPYLTCRSLEEFLQTRMGFSL